MEHLLKFGVESAEMRTINQADYDSEEFAIVRLGFLSTMPNSHKLDISDEVLRSNAESALGKWLVADMTAVVDAGGHTEKEHIVGRIEKDQDVEFVTDSNGYTKAYVDAVVSKIYAKDFVEMFKDDNKRSVSVEMKVYTAEGNDNKVEGFNVVGVTVLGHAINPSCPDADVTFTRFSAEDSETYYHKATRHNAFEELKSFADSKTTEAKSYKVDKSKDAMSDKAWGDVDKTALRKAVTEAKNAGTLVKSVYLLVEPGWKEAPSEHLKYPVMELKGDTFVYNRGGLASALGYAEKEDETAVVNKIHKIYKGLGLNSDGKEDDVKMAMEIEFAAVNIGGMWDSLWNILHNKYPDGEWSSVYRIEGIYEEDNQKFAVIRHKDEDALYRLDFSLTEEGMTVSDKIVKCEIEIVETDDVKKFAQPEDMSKFEDKEPEPKDDGEGEGEGDDDKGHDGPKDEDMSKVDWAAQCESLQAACDEKDNIIMGLTAELEELRKFKADIEDKQKLACVNKTMEFAAKYLDEDAAKAAREEGMACEFSAVDAWSNKVKASIADKVMEHEGLTVMSAPKSEKKSGSVWGRL